MSKTTILTLAIVLLAAVLFVSVASAEVVGTLDYSVSTTAVELSDAGDGSFSMTTPGSAAPYAGVQFVLQLPEGVQISSVDYSLPGAVAIAPAVPPGDPGQDTYYFGCFAEENRFTAALTCTVSIAYAGTARTSLTIREIKQYTVSGIGTNDRVTDRTTAVALIPSGGGGPGDGPGGNPGDNTGGGGTGGGGTGGGAIIPSTDGGTELGDGQDLPGGGGQGDASGPGPTILLDKSGAKGYISGYPDNTVRAENDITRYETAVMFHNLILDAEKDSYANQKSRFSDAEAGKWYSAAVGYLTAAEVLVGYPDGTFRGDNPITRAEFATIVSRLSETAAGGDVPFTDVPASHWAYGFIRSAYGNGLVIGYPDGTFGPERNITRAEAIAITNRLLGWDPSSAAGGAAKFSDLAGNEWYYNDIVLAANGLQGR